MKDKQKKCYICSSYEHLKRDFPHRAKYDDASTPARAKGRERDEGKRNMKTNFTRRDVLGIFGEDQDVGTENWEMWTMSTAYMK